MNKTNRAHFASLANAAFQCAVALALAGCGAGKLATVSAPATGAALQGVFMGGQQPVAGVTVQLYEASSAGYGAASIKLGPSTQTTTSGNFNLPSYTCDSGSQVYLVGTGGQPIAATPSTPAVTNNNLALMVGLGACGGSGLSGFINVNELTTVATVWALSPFMTDAAHIGTSSTNTAGLTNAFGAINQVVNTATGAISGPALPAEATLPITEIDTLADILEQCVNSGGGTAGNGSNCGNLFQLAPDASGTVYPTDTISAALNIAKNPARNVALLNRLRSASPVFQPVLNVNSPPNAWTIAITYTGGGISAPSGVAVDQTGNVWLSNSGNNSVTRLDPNGNALSPNAGYTGSFNAPSAIAIDQGGYAWVTNSGNNSLVQLSPAGTSPTILTGNGLTAPHAIAIDATGSVFVANKTSVSSFTNSGAVLNSSGSTAATPAPSALAINPK